MPFDIDQLVNNSSDKLLKSGLVHRIMSNPIYTALLITTLVYIIMWMLLDNQKNSGRALFWIFVSSLTVIFLNNKVIREENSAIEDDKTYNTIFGASQPPELFENMVVPISPISDSL